MRFWNSIGSGPLLVVGLCVMFVLLSTVSALRFKKYRGRALLVITYRWTLVFSVPFFITWIFQLSAAVAFVLWCMVFLTFFSFPFPFVGEAILRYVFFKGQNAEDDTVPRPVEDETYKQQDGFDPTRATRETKVLVGEVVTALTDFRPRGRIRVNGMEFEAVAELGFIEQGEAVEVTGVDGSGELVVRRAGIRE